MNNTTWRSKIFILISSLMLAGTFAVSYGRSTPIDERTGPAASTAGPGEPLAVAPSSAGPTHLSRCGDMDGRTCERDGQTIKCLSPGGTGHCFCTDLSWTCIDAPL